jgi:hypothetical protein
MFSAETRSAVIKLAAATIIIAYAGCGDDSPARAKVVGPGESVFVGDLKVDISGAGIGTWMGGRFPDGSPMQESVMMVTVRVENTNQNLIRKIRSAVESAVLKDDVGNEYQCIGRKGPPSDEVYPKAIDEESLVFRVPVRTASDLILTIDAANYGGTGVLSFRLPKTNWVRKE